eukprot:m.5324 g.5324  ORF g.5324 m.5324 type:complete len:73 (-) comp3596_c0_seq1:315-533(-)
MAQGFEHTPLHGNRVVLDLIGEYLETAGPLRHRRCVLADTSRKIVFDAMLDEILAIVKSTTLSGETSIERHH